jgi:hypothetical protein
MCADWGHYYIQRLGLDEHPLDKSLLADVREIIVTFLMEKVITAEGKFHADETVWANIVFVDKEIFAFLLVHEFLHFSLSMNFCDIVAFLLGRCISSLYVMVMLNFVI